MSFTVVMTIAVVLLAAGWTAYGIYEYKMRQKEKNQPKQVSEHLQKRKTEVTDWAKKMAQWESPVKKQQRRREQQDQS